MSANAPLRIGRYLLHREIASGGMASVWFGQLVGPVGFSRVVAVKRMRRELVGNAEFVRMFVDEARLTARVQHPNVVSILDVVSDAGELFIVLELVRGESLSQLQKARRGEPVPVAVASAIVSQSLAGLHAAHETRDSEGKPLGLVHRDISPQNILVGVDGLARITDFGVAKASERLQRSAVGQVKGKLAYMPPEQLIGEVVDRRADVYAMGVVLWEALAGRKLLQGGTPELLIADLVAGQRPTLRSLRGDVSPELEKVVDRAIAKEPAERFPTADAFEVELERAAAPAPARSVREWVLERASDRMDEVAKILEEIEESAPSLGSADASLRQHVLRAMPLRDAPPDGAREAPTAIVAPPLRRDRVEPARQESPPDAKPLAPEPAAEDAPILSAAGASTAADAAAKFGLAFDAEPPPPPVAPETVSSEAPAPSGAARRADRTLASDADRDAEGDLPAVPAVVGDRYDVGPCVGAGGMGVVHKAKDRREGRDVAIKFLTGAADFTRFRREWRILASAASPAIVAYVDHGTTSEGLDYLVTEWLDGKTLADVLEADASLTVGEALTLGVDLARALAHLHAQGILHRDVKPANVFLVGAALGDLKLLDFGLARTWEREPSRGSGVTRTGVAVGTPGYMAPEQARGETKLDARVDVFSIGCVLYRCLTGHVPYGGDDAVSVLLQTLLAQRRDLEAGLSALPAPARSAIVDLVAADREQRPADAERAATVIERVRDGLSAAERDKRVVPTTSSPKQVTLDELLLNRTQEPPQPSRRSIVRYAPYAAPILIGTIVAVVGWQKSRAPEPAATTSATLTTAASAAPSQDAMPSSSAASSVSVADVAPSASASAPIGSASSTIPKPPPTAIADPTNRDRAVEQAAANCRQIQARMNSCVPSGATGVLSVIIEYTPLGRAVSRVVDSGQNAAAIACVDAMAVGTFVSPYTRGIGTVNCSASMAY